MRPPEITGQAIGAGGDRLQVWTHPTAASTGYREGGWSYEALQDNAGSLFGPGALQSFGEEFLPLPAELQPEPATSEAAESEAVQAR